jgi:hypothetical protein
MPPTAWAPPRTLDMSGRKADSRQVILSEAKNLS